MVELNVDIDGDLKTYNFPNSWDEVSVGMYDKIVNVDRENKNEITMLIDLVSVITGMNRDDVGLFTVEQVDQISKALKFVYTPIKKPSKKFIKIDGEKYYLKSDFDKLNFAEVESLQVLQDKYSEQFERGIPEMLCLFLRKKAKNGELEAFRNSFMERAELFKENVMISDIHQVFVFFSDGKKK